MSNRTDNFDDRANGASPGTPSDSGSAWIEGIGGWAIDKPASDGAAYNWNDFSNSVMAVETGDANGTAQVTVETVGQGGGICFRYVDEDNHWFFAWNSSDNYCVYKRVAGTYTKLDGVATLQAAGDVLSAVLSDGDIACKLNGTTIISLTGQTDLQTATKHGVYANKNAVRLDDFSWSTAGADPATAYTLTPPAASGQVNRPTGDFSVAPNGTYTGTITLTPSGGGLTGSDAVVLTWTSESSLKTAEFTPTSPGTVTITPTNSEALTDPDAVTYESSIVTEIVPGAQIYDVNGDLAHLHQGNANYDSATGKYWVYGVNMTGTPVGFPSPTAIGVYAYWSTDFLNWTPTTDGGTDGLVQGPTISGDTYTVLERPKVFKHPVTGRIVMLIHLDDSNYTTRLLGILSAPGWGESFDTVEYVGKIDSNDVLDIGAAIFGGTLYLYFSSPAGMKVVPLNSDWDGFGTVVTLTLPDLSPPEAAAPFEDGGKYYLICSAQTGWTHNANQAYSADSPTQGTWTKLAYPFVTSGADGAATSYNSQSNAVFRFPNGDLVYLADRFENPAFSESTYVWLPLTFNGSDAEIAWVDEWTPDTGTPADPAPEIVVSHGETTLADEDTVDYGTIAQAASLPTEVIAIANTGDAALSLSCAASGDVEIVGTPPTSIAASGSADVTVRLKSTAATGSKTGTLTITSNDADESQTDIQFTATVTDQTAPTVTSARFTTEAADEIRVNLSETSTGTAGFSVDDGGAAVTVTPTNHGTYILLALSRAMDPDATTLAYARASGDVEDAAGNELADFSGRAVVAFVDGSGLGRTVIGIGIGLGL